MARASIDVVGFGKMKATRQMGIEKSWNAYVVPFKPRWTEHSVGCIEQRKAPE